MRSPGPDRQIRIRCPLPERFLEKAREEGLQITEATVEDRSVLRLRARGSDARALLALAERYSLTVLEDRALGPDPFAAWKELLSITAGFLLTAAILLLLSGRIWNVRAVCPAGGSTQDALDALRDMGVTLGAPFPDMDTLAARVESVCPRYAHVSVSKRGATLIVELYETTEAPEVYSPEAERDLVSLYDAIVSEVTVLGGQAAVRPGDAVRRGQAVILGIERETDETTRGLAALGEVKGYIWLYGEATAPTHVVKRAYTGNVSAQTELRLFDWRLPLTDGERYALFEERSEYLPVGGLFLPLRILRVTRAEYTEERIPAGKDRLTGAVGAMALANALSRLPEDSVIIDKWIDYSMIREESVIARACVKVLVSIAGTREQAG